MAKDFAGVYDSRGRCRIQWSEGGKRRSRVLEHPYTPSGIRSAYKVKCQLERSFKRGELSSEGASRKPTFGQMAQQTLKTTTHRPSTRRVALLHLNKYWMPEFNNTPIDQITTPMLRMHFAELTMIKAPKYLKNIFSSASVIFERAIEDEWITQNPVTAISKKIKVTKKIVDPFTVVERDQILDNLNEDHQVLFYLIRFYMGLRPGEVIALRWSDYRNGEFAVTKTRSRGGEQPPKNNLERSVPVHPKVEAALKKTVRQLKNNHIITNAFGDQYASPVNLARAFSTVTERLKLRYRSPYACRHTCASMMLSAGMAPALCAEYLGHTQQMFFSKYAKLIRDSSGDDKQREIWASVL